MNKIEQLEQLIEQHKWSKEQQEIYCEKKGIDPELTLGVLKMNDFRNLEIEALELSLEIAKGEAHVMRWEEPMSFVFDEVNDVMAVNDGGYMGITFDNTSEDTRYREADGDIFFSARYIATFNGSPAIPTKGA